MLPPLSITGLRFLIMEIALKPGRSAWFSSVIHLFGRLRSFSLIMLWYLDIPVNMHIASGAAGTDSSNANICAYERALVVAVDVEESA